MGVARIVLIHPPLSQKTTEILVTVPVVPVLSVVEGAVVPLSVEVANRLEVLEVLEVTAPGRFPWTMSSRMLQAVWQIT